MYQTTIKIDRVTDVEEIKGKGDRALHLRWVVGKSEDKILAFKAWNDFGQHAALVADAEVNLEFKIDTREHNGKFFTELTITKIL